MADKPSRALVLYGDGLARHLSPALTHLRSFASYSSCGFLALPPSPPSEDEETRILREFAELLDSNQDVEQLFMDNYDEKKTLLTLSQRFMGMKAALITDHLGLTSLGCKLGLTVLHWNDLCASTANLPFVASGILKLLGFEEGGKILNSNQFDLVCAHVGAGERVDDLREEKFINDLVGHLEQIQSKTDISTRLHVSVVMSYGVSLEDDDCQQFSISTDTKNKNNDELLSLMPFPRQSYMMKGGKLRESIRQHCPMLFAQYQDAVTRKDMVESFTFRDFIENGGNLVIPADRFLHEVAFKLWKAPKYGA